MFKEILTDAFPIIQKVAPTLATAIASPLANAFSVWAVNLLASAFGIAPANLHQLNQTILDDPDADSKIGGLEEQFADWFKKNFDSIKMPNKAEINVKLEWTE